MSRLREAWKPYTSPEAAREDFAEFHASLGTSKEIYDRIVNRYRELSLKERETIAQYPTRQWRTLVDSVKDNAELQRAFPAPEKLDEMRARTLYQLMYTSLPGISRDPGPSRGDSTADEEGDTGGETGGGPGSGKGSAVRPTFKGLVKRLGKKTSDATSKAAARAAGYKGSTEVSAWGQTDSRMLQLGKRISDVDEPGGSSDVSASGTGGAEGSGPRSGSEKVEEDPVRRFHRWQEEGRLDNPEDKDDWTGKTIFESPSPPPPDSLAPGEAEKWEELVLQLESDVDCTEKPDLPPTQTIPKLRRIATGLTNTLQQVGSRPLRDDEGAGNE